MSQQNVAQPAASVGDYRERAQPVMADEPDIEQAGHIAILEEDVTGPRVHAEEQAAEKEHGAHMRRDVDGKIRAGRRLDGVVEVTRTIEPAIEQGQAAADLKQHQADNEGFDDDIAIPVAQGRQDCRMQFEAPDRGQVVAEMHGDEHNDECCGADPVRETKTGTQPDTGYEAPPVARYPVCICGAAEPCDCPGEVIATWPAEHGEDDAERSEQWWGGRDQMA